MKVELKTNWFSPTEKMGESLAQKSGRLYRKGIVEIDARWEGMLPKGSVILDKPAPVVEEAAPAPAKAAKAAK
jgi:hypothetical protein